MSDKLTAEEARVLRLILRRGGYLWHSELSQLAGAAWGKFVDRVGKRIVLTDAGRLALAAWEKENGV